MNLKNEFKAYLILKIKFLPSNLKFKFRLD
jgi:hypothetical protein